MKNKLIEYEAKDRLNDRETAKDENENGNE